MALNCGAPRRAQALLAEEEEQRKKAAAKAEKKAAAKKKKVGAAGAGPALWPTYLGLVGAAKTKSCRLAKT